MPFFPWKSGKKDKAVANSKSTRNPPSSNGHVPPDPDDDFAEFGGAVRPKTLLLKSVSFQDIEKGDLGGGQSNIRLSTPVLTSSRLSKTLYEILHDRDALPYFIQYMEFRSAGSFLRFWLDAESFQASSMTRARSRSQLSLGKSSMPSQAIAFQQQQQHNNVTTAELTTPCKPEPGSRQQDENQIRAQDASVNTYSNSSSCDIDKGNPHIDTESPKYSQNFVMDKHSDDDSNNESSCDNELMYKQCVDGKNSIQYSGSDNNNISKNGDDLSNQVSSQSTSVIIRSSRLSEEVSISRCCAAAGGNNDNSAHGGSCSSVLASPTLVTSGQCDASSTFTHSTASVGGGVNISQPVSLGEFSMQSKDDPTTKGASTSCSNISTNRRDMCGGAMLEQKTDISISQGGSNGSHINSSLSEYVPSSKDHQNSNDNDSNVNNSSSRLLSGDNGNVKLSASIDMDHSMFSSNMGRVLNKEVGNSKGATSKKAIEDKLLQSIAKDAVSIFSKYIAKDATHPIGVTEELRADTIRKICREDGLVDPHSFAPCQDFVVQIMKERYHIDFLVSEYHSKHQIDILTGSKVYLGDILYNDNAFSYFMQYMEQEGAMPLLQCWMELDNFQQLLVDRQSQYDSMEAQNDAMIIYDKYFSLQATRPLGFSDSVRFEVEANICREEGPLPDCFAKAKKIVVHVLDNDYFLLFLKSAIFYKYLQDLINSVQLSDIPSVQKERKSTDNDSGSEHSFGSQGTTHSDGISGRNTLLATGVSKALSKMDDNMQIDNILFNPDELYKRPEAGNLSLGRIDELGNYVSDIDTELLDTKKGGLFFNKKSREKEKTQEDMAAQIAQMIIKDCTNTQ